MKGGQYNDLGLKGANTYVWEKADIVDGSVSYTHLTLPTSDLV